jgi:hypothetical protein
MRGAFLALLLIGCGDNGSGSPGDGGATDLAACSNCNGGSPDLAGADLAGVPTPLSMLPDTTVGIHLFADQFSNGYSDRLVHFAATHFAGTQKMLKAENQRYVAVNANWLLLHYRLGSSSGPVQYIHDNTWSSDWTDVTSHEDWFMHNMNGARHHEATDNWDINDIMNAGFRTYWVSSVIADMRATGAQGVFADSYEAGISGYGVTDPDTRFDGTNPGNATYWANGVTWLDQKTLWYQYIEAQFAQTPERFLFVPNIGAMITGWANIDYSGIDGAMLEGFGYQLAESDWVLGMNRAMKLTAAGKFIILQSYPSDVQGRQFLIATYLLMKGTKTFLNLAGSGVTWFPEYALDLGAPSAGLPSDVSGYQWSGVYRRDFAKGMVLVNPSSATVSVTLPMQMQQASASGGGMVSDSDLDATGDNYVSGSLTFAPVTTLSLPAQSAALLTK